MYFFGLISIEALRQASNYDASLTAFNEGVTGFKPPMTDVDQATPSPSRPLKNKR